MPGRRPLLSRGRGASLLLVGAIAITAVSGWARGELLTALAGPLVGLPWLPLRRLALGLALDLPAAAATAILCVAAGRVLIRSGPAGRTAWLASLALAAAVWGLDAALAWLVLDDLGLWSDPLVLAGRGPMVALALAGGAYALGWRPRRRGAPGPGAGAGQNGFDGAGAPG